MTLKVYTSVLDNEIDEAGEVLSKFIVGDTPLSGFAVNKGIDYISSKRYEI